jgi:hypothetical protein
LFIELKLKPFNLLVFLPDQTQAVSVNCDWNVPFHESLDYVCKQYSIKKEKFTPYAIKSFDKSPTDECKNIYFF